MKLPDLLSRIDAVDERDGWLAPCPSHSDSRASLRIAVSDAGKVLLKCRAGCSTVAIVKALGMSMRELATMEPGDVPTTRRATSALPATPGDIARLALRVNGYAQGATSPAADGARAYAKTRFGITADDFTRLGLGYADDIRSPKDSGTPRLVVPFRDPDGVARNFQGRALAAELPEGVVRWLGPKSPEGGSWAKTGYFPGNGLRPEVLICEGPGDALTGAGLGYDTIGIAGASHAENPAIIAEVASWVGDRVAVIAGDGDEAGRRFATRLAEGLLAEGVAVRELHLDDGLDLTDWRAKRGPAMAASVGRAIAAAELRQPAAKRASEPEAPEEAPKTRKASPRAPKAPKPAPDDSPGTKPLSGLAPRDIVAAILSRYEFARTPEGGIVTIERDENGAGIAEEVSDLPATIARMVWDEAKESLKPTEMSSAKTTLTAIANSAPVRPAPLRSFEARDGIYVDLGRDDGRIVYVSADGWEVLPARSQDAPAFRRTRATEPLPIPVRGGTRDVLREVLGFTPDDPTWRLVYGWLVGALFEATSRPVLWVSGPQGSGKSTRARMVKSVLDPALGPTGREGALGAAPTGDERDDTTSASGQFVPSWDNISSVHTATSDWFCTLVTGAATARRRLYTDGDMYIQRIRRTGVATSIAMPLGLRPDALERLVVVEFERVPMERRQTEGSVWREFLDAHPVILGALLDDLVGVLANLHEASRQGIALPRMADYAEHLIALDLHVGLDPRSEASYAGAYIASVREAIASRASDEPLVAALVKLASTRKGYGYRWEGTATELRDALADDRPGDPSEWWPSGPAQLSAEVLKHTEACRALGLQVERIKSNGARRVVLTWHGDPADAPEDEPEEDAPKLARATPAPEAVSPHDTPTHTLGGASLDDLPF